MGLNTLNASTRISSRLRSASSTILFSEKSVLNTGSLDSTFHPIFPYDGLGTSSASGLKTGSVVRPPARGSTAKFSRTKFHQAIKLPKFATSSGTLRLYGCPDRDCGIAFACEWPNTDAAGLRLR